MIEQLIISVLFIAALLYLLNIVKKNFTAKAQNTGCVKGCGSCQATLTGKTSPKEIPTC